MSRLPTHTSERPRERLLARGAAALTSPELLAIVLRTGTSRQDVLQLSRLLIEQFHGLRGLLAAEPKALLSISGLGKAKTCELLAISELSRRALAESLGDKHAMNNPATVKHYCQAMLGHLTVEHCMALYLDSQYRLICTEEISRGTLTQASIYPREVVKSALRHHAAAIILAHNHPSGLQEPSQADLHLTQHLKRALSLVDVQLLDHLIVTACGATSLAERGQI
ncbi:DNA repair protein RadC [Pusillimonas sp. CC-YST705]|uniref:DNA repair protein RadC n=1 Tax=Mesopusillimonas faecipullorum TaxID=2755040 RepID=A0ABS8C8D5_9BURK|nr:DNA repair protein RadC [Mesopusillimonas faecipullorum]MCB5362285.1 DNA repair protein RadC [Mesopusillimonas faecipullorum]